MSDVDTHVRLCSAERGVPAGTASGEQTIDALWFTFCQASRRAQASQLVADGIAAGHAWRDWLDTFAPVPSATSRVLPKPLPGGTR